MDRLVPIDFQIPSRNTSLSIIHHENDYLYVPLERKFQVPLKSKSSTK